MNILVVDQTAEGQTHIARMIELFEATDRDTLDIHVSLTNPSAFSSRVAQSDVLILGSGLGESALLLAKQAKEISNDIEVIMLASDRHYSSEAFRMAHLARVRKVIPAGATSLDLLQELVLIHEQFCYSGKAKKGKLIVVTQAKGGLGSTTFIAALAEISNETKNYTLLWDLDIESKDLSRGLNAAGAQSQLVTSWVTGSRDLTRESLKESFIPVGPYVSLLPPPHDIAAAMDLIGHPESIKTVHRTIELARVCQDAIIVDAAGKLNPATGTLLRMADEIIVLIDDTLLGLSAACTYLETLMSILKNNTSALRILCSGTRLAQGEIRRLLSAQLSLPESAWILPTMPTDAFADKWPGTGKTMYSGGQKTTRKTLESIAGLLGLVDHNKVTPISLGRAPQQVSWVRTILQRANA